MRLRRLRAAVYRHQDLWIFCLVGQGAFWELSLDYDLKAADDWFKEDSEDEEPQELPVLENISGRHAPRRNTM